MLKTFPKSRIVPVRAEIGIGNLGKPAITVWFEPFDIMETYEDETYGDETVVWPFDAPLRADFIELPTIEPSELQNRNFDFPANPVDGYIDA